MESEEALKRISRQLLTVSAAASLVVLTACSQGAEDPPALSDIDSALWQNMRQEESVTIRTTLARIADSLEVEVRALPAPRLVAQLQPQALADLVGGRLARPAQVAVQLEGVWRSSGLSGRHRIW